MLSRAQAAEYLGVSPGTFDHEVQSGMWPQPLRRGTTGRRLTWDRCALDAAADALSGINGATPEEKNPWDEIMQPGWSPVYLHSRETKVLEYLARSPHRFEARAWIPDGVGDKTLAALLERGFLERGPCSRYKGQEGWGITEEGRKAIRRP